MCIIPASQLSSDDLAVLGCRSASRDTDEPGPEFTITHCQPGDAFGFGPVALSQLIRPVDPCGLDRAA
jgi:hypothetical protein